jgi:hypothetical protein
MCHDLGLTPLWKAGQARTQKRAAVRSDWPRPLETCRDPCAELDPIDRSVGDTFDDADRLAALRVAGLGLVTMDG